MMPAKKGSGYVALVAVGTQGESEIRAEVLSAYAARGVYDADDCLIITMVGMTPSPSGPVPNTCPITICDLGMGGRTA